MRNSLMIAALLLPCMALAEPPFYEGSAYGDFRHHHRHAGKGADHFPRLLSGINLSAQQQEDVKNLLNNSRAKFDPELEEIKKVEEELHRLSFSNDFSDKKIQTLLDKSASLHKELSIFKATVDNSIYKLLTDEQKRKLQSNITRCE
ncbi:Spy/CpxP family protein refolding chaperone [Candidatus Methylospira mobilis]|nr:Spy/CpxP family protein refolding chaperone [Candidatus Methylospira mobilis]WNV05723.1 Spy/CpxP family protein refolding chaperone [Candidatus Methylospira mobilis]